MSSAFSDHLGKTSIMRVALFLIIMAVLISYLWECYWARSMVSPNPDVLKALGFLLGAKLFQNHQETVKPGRNHEVDLRDFRPPGSQ